MPKLNQIIAVVNGRKSKAQSALTVAYHKLQKAEPFQGIKRTYQPKDEEGERLPSEAKRVQLTVPEIVQEVRRELSDLFDAVATLETANTGARADVKVGNVVVASSVPVTYLLFLEKQLVDLATFVSKLPTLDPADRWEYSREADCYASDEISTVRTKKIPRSFVKYEATEEHPAQVEMFHEDVVVGNWNTVKFSGAIPEARKNQMLERVRKLQDAVKFAREEANSIEVENKTVAEGVFDYLFSESAA